MCFVPHFSAYRWEKALAWSISHSVLGIFWSSCDKAMSVLAIQTIMWFRSEGESMIWEFIGDAPTRKEKNYQRGEPYVRIHIQHQSCLLLARSDRIFHFQPISVRSPRWSKHKSRKMEWIGDFSMVTIIEVIQFSSWAAQAGLKASKTFSLQKALIGSLTLWIQCDAVKIEPKRNTPWHF